jgi:septal ring factor EnvC (AmiA/AmiB activator)
MAPSYSPPPRPVRHKHAAISSPPNPLMKYSRDQSEIALKWWSQKKATVVTLEEKLEKSQAEVASLEEELNVANKKIAELEAELEDTINRQDKNAAEVLKAVDEHGGFKKITDKAAQLLAIGAILVSFLGIIMKRSHNITRLRAVCDAIFNNLIFGAEATAIVLEEIYHKYIFSEQRRVFLLWKILRVIDLCMAGSLNYSGVEAL